ncbi:nucleotide sugar dehydrogenase [Paenibacillus sp. XY044]|uniref:nucleotide sugar dehydrogenase n=1 Tax=Paenibacillus sp. XY044 TaxID=2026089 RepID=UPI000B983BB5|nr:nucleotide sugar dehydrogenase [Paenibacillus sp. XY044]OZB98510.1 UDP-N-acetyl-D-galactosamine dehydrogenase [Paenibacillus sp. XY044]
MSKPNQNVLNVFNTVAVIGLGYVGLPLAQAFSQKIRVIGFDVNPGKISRLQEEAPPDVEMSEDDISPAFAGLEFTSDEERLSEARFYVIAVPTPVQSGNVPDLRFVEAASRMVGRKLRQGAVVVYESTVYPGVTEEICVPILEAESGLRCGKDFKVGYSPERINPGDDVHRLDNIVKIVSGMDEESLGIIAGMYEQIIDAGVYRAESIKVAEAAKVIENAQRDINIAFMNELSMLFHQMGIDTQEVLRAAGTKWNFLNFVPGLVGGHCIGIDPYYLTYKAEDSGIRSRIILAARHINDGMGKYVAEQLIKMLVRQRLDLRDVKVGVLGLTYKEDCSDIRNSKVVDIVRELQDYGIEPLIVDPLVDPQAAYAEYGLEMSRMENLQDLHVLVTAVPHQCFAGMRYADMDAMFRKDSVKILLDVKGVYDKAEFERQGYIYWRL